MGLRINNNIAAMNAYRNLSATDSAMSKSLEKLSSGFRINRAADDAAGLSISEGLRSQIGGLKQAVRNAQDGVNVVQTADGALTEVHSILQRMRDLAVQASNSGSQDSTARNAAQTELSQLNQELDRIGGTTRFGNSKLLDGTFGNTAASLSGAISGVTSGSLTTAVDFKLSGSFQKADGTFGTLAATSVTLASATYNGAGAYQTALQNGIDSVMTAGGYAAGTVKASVADAGNGVWKVTLSSDKALTNATTGATFTVADGGSAGSAAAAGLRATSSTTTGVAGGIFQIGANAGESINISISAVTSAGLGLGNIDLVNSASGAITAIDTAISSVSNQRANLGAYQNRFEHTVNNLNVAVQNLTASESQIRDTDMAQEMTNFTRNQILSQAGTAMLAQANQASQGVLQLLRG
ncbi:MAG: flagellin N-terminal helical domain-containing protein [Actinomycetales bacterium]